MAAEARKYDDGKARFDLIPAIPLQTLAEVYTFGAKKYADRNWEGGIKWGRVFAAICRHLWAYWRGEDVDKESGMTHLAHAAWGCFTLMEFQRTHKELDDRPGTTHPIEDVDASQIKMFGKDEGGRTISLPNGLSTDTTAKSDWTPTDCFGLPGKLWTGTIEELLNHAEKKQYSSPIVGKPKDFSGLQL